MEARLDFAALEGLHVVSPKLVKRARDRFLAGGTMRVQRGSRSFTVAATDPGPPGGPPTMRTGGLANSISAIEPRRSGGRFVAGLKSDHVAAGVHEGISRSGRRRPGGLTIRAKNGGRLRFATRDGFVSVRSVKVMPRPFLRPALVESLEAGEINDEVLNAIERMTLEEINRG